MAVRQPIIVIGSGVSGLTTGIVLLESGLPLEIWTRDPAQATTSAVAGALWHPYAVSPEDRAMRWAFASMDVFCELAADECTGIRLHEGCANGEPGQRPIVEMPRYLSYLEDRFLSLGGKFKRCSLSSLADPLAGSPIVINCAGLGARDLVSDDQLFPSRGQLVRVAQRGIDRYAWTEDETGQLAYVIPRAHDVILGGTHQDRDENLATDEKDVRGILERCRALEPRLDGVEVLDTPVGLRPCRHTVRLETEEQPGGNFVIHNYGHGGAGVTLSWGCAQEAATMVRELTS